MPSAKSESVLPIDRRQRPLHDLRISVTDRCNFRCSYCMPTDVYDHEYQHLPRQDILRFEEIVRLARLFVQLGVKKFGLPGANLCFVKIWINWWLNWLRLRVWKILL